MGETHLPRRISWVILGMAAAMCFGDALPEIARLTQTINKTDPWNFPDAPFHGLPKYLVLVASGFLAWKQMSYYYFAGGSKGAIFSKLILHMNALERSIDWLLAIEGALLLPWSVFHPSTWVFGFLLYCIIAFCRVVVALRRPKYADYWKAHEFSASLIYPWCTYPFNWVSRVELPGMPPRPGGLSNKQLILWIFANSLLAQHTPIENPHKVASVREILWGWRASFIVHGSVALLLGIITICVWVWLGRGATRWLAIINAGAIAVLFWRLSKWSFHVGRRKYHDF